MSRYYVSQTGEEVAGPFTAGQVRSMWFAGTFNADAKICTEGIEFWRPLADFIEERQVEEQAAVASPGYLFPSPASMAVDPPRQKKSGWIGCFGWGLLAAVALVAAVPWLVAFLPVQPTFYDNLPTYEAVPDYALEKWVKAYIPDPAAKIAGRSNPFKTWDGLSLVAADVRGRNAFGGWVETRYVFVWDGEANAIGVPIDEMIDDLEVGVRSTESKEEAQGKSAMLNKLREWKGKSVLDGLE